MAMQSNSPVTLTFPPFRGVTRKLVLAAMAAFVLQVVIGIAFPRAGASLILVPQLAFHAMPWQFVTYAFLAEGLLNTLFALLALWFFGADLEQERGGRWLGEYALVSTIGGGVLAALLSYAHIPEIGPGNLAFGLWPMVLALTLAFGRRNPEAEVR